ncbi:TonB-dependent receptor [Bacteroides graminisolvens]|uniref:SusC/RagA family TonB-linked outer membrane protein n=1 Tax=Bacteroides graminisolvens TaxID=477666 RepID=UPI0029C934E1|nr:TonB-dependent receptor [Bacteroides graminisolvens]
MNLNSRKTALIAKICLSFLIGGVPSAFATLPVAVETTQQNGKVTGTVVDQYGESVIGANVLQKGTTNGVITDIDGNFVLNVPRGATLEVSFVGYVTQSVKVTGPTIKIVLVEDSKALEEVVVVGYGVQKKKLVTGATVQVKGEQLAALNTTSALTAMQSMSPGVNITQSSGQPGEGFKVNIRGLGTVGSYAPLYVIDGITGGDINSLNPSDIESIDVLKDAASCAIYGARGANGVILVTTKQGKIGKIQVTYDGYFGWQNSPKMPELLNAKQYMEVQDLIMFNQGGEAIDWEGKLSSGLYNSIMDGSYQGTNWLKLIHNDDAPITNHALNVVGGNDMSKFSLGVSYTSQEGIYGRPVQSDFERTSVRLNSDHVLWKKGDLDVISLSENMTYNYKTKSGIGIGNQYWNDISNVLRANPITPAYNESGDIFAYDDLLASGIFGIIPGAGNPLGDMIYNRGNNISKNHALNMSATLKIQPIKNLVWRSQFNYKMSSNSYRQYVPKYKINPSVNSQAQSDRTQQSASQGWSYSWENTLNYKFSIDTSHNIDLLAGTSIEKWGMGESMEATNSGGLWSDWDHAWLDNMKDVGTASATGSPWGEGGLASFFGRVNYDYKEKYMFSAIVRHDGSSNFASGNRWGTFPSFSAGWVMTNEEFMKDLSNWLDFLKLRASWGQNGNCNVAGFQYLATVSFDKTAAYAFNNQVNNPQTGGYANKLPNADITWETSEQLNFGFDARLFRSRLGVAFDWYKKTTKDWLVNAPVLGHYGTGAPDINGGDVENTGIELALNWNDKAGKEFTYTVGVNMAYNKNEVTRIANAEGILHGPSNVLSQGTTEMYRAEVGQPIGYFWGYKTAGVFQNAAEIDAWKAAGNATMSSNPVPGDLIFVDLNGDKAITDADKTNIGNPHPDLTAGLNLNFGYKGFDLTIAGYGAFGHQIAKSYRKFGDGQYDNYTTDVYDTWHGEGTSNKLPRLVPGNNYNYLNISDIYMEDADFFRLQNITLGYDFKKLFPRAPFQQARLYVTAQNLFTITGYSGMDPEVGASGDETNYSWGSGIDLGFYPSPRTFLVGVNLKF